MKFGEADWSAFLRHVHATLEAFRGPKVERDEVAGFVESLKADIVEA